MYTFHSSSGMLENGGSSGAAGTLQQEMNPDISDVDLGATTASWKILAQRVKKILIIKIKQKYTHLSPECF